MDKLDPNNYNIPEQQRAEKAIEAIIQAGKELIALDKAEELTTRRLTEKSGYSTGTLYRYFKKVDDVFVFLLVKRRKELFDDLANKISKHSPTDDVTILADTVTRTAIETWKKTVSKRVFLMFIRQYFKRTPEPEMFQAVGDLLIPALTEVQRQDKTNTIKAMDEHELRLAIRCIQTAVNSPMLEGLDFAGSEEHKKITREIAIKLFKK